MVKEKFTFSGHETFHCKNMWLKKGYDFVKNDGKFNDEACLVLGVGRNMVNSIRYWLRAFNIINRDTEEITEFGKFIFDDELGRDKYLEDESTLWLLHHQLVHTNYASIYNIIFNEIAKLNPEFNLVNIQNYLEKNQVEFNRNTVKKDFQTFLKTYLSKEEKNIEDAFSAILVRLELIHQNEKKKYYIQNNKQDEIPEDLILFLILSEPEFGSSISFNALYSGWNSLGNILGLSYDDLDLKLKALSTKYVEVNYSSNAGIKEIQILKDKFSPFEILSEYYGN